MSVHTSTPKALHSSNGARHSSAPGPTASHEGTRSAPEPHVVILNQYYAPDIASTGHLLHELAVELVHQGFPVSVVTTRPSYGPPETWVACPLREQKDGVDVRRMWTTRLSKDRLIGRAVNYMTFFGQLGMRMLFGSRRNRVYLYTTNPPFLGIIGAMVSLVRSHRYVLLLHDSYPHLAVWVGTIRKGGFIERVWHTINRLYYARADRTIVLCQAAKRLVCENYGVSPDRVHVIPNWADGETLKPREKSASQFARQHQLTNVFTAMYSGNLGLYYEFETMLAAAGKLMGDPFRLVLVGSGGRRTWIKDEISDKNLTNTLLLPYQPLDRLPDSLSACDASLVTIAKGIEGVSFPSKLYSSLAIGRPIIALSEPDSELRSLVEGEGVGRWFEIGDADGLVKGIREMIADPASVAEQGRRARALFEKRYSREASAASYAEVMRLADPRVRAVVGRAST